MIKRRSSRQWMARHLADPYVKQAQRDGYRSRAAYKLLEIQEKDRLLRPGLRVLDLGAAPGGWSQVAASLVKPGGRVVALDLLPMDPIPAVTLIQGDFREEAVLAQVRDTLEGTTLDLVLSDMAPNITGVAITDQMRAIHLAELAVAAARELLRPGGDLLIKAFHGVGFDALVPDLRGSFARVVARKPKASRAESREVYLVARGFQP